MDGGGVASIEEERELARAVAALRRATSERDAAAERVLEVERQVARLRADLEESARREARLRAVIAGIQSSVSWRAMRPLRQVRRSGWFETMDEVDAWVDR